MDTTVLIAVIALCGTALTVAGGIIVAIITSGKESKSSATSALEKALRERLILRDEQIEDLKQDLAQCEEKGTRKDAVITQLMKEKASRDIELERRGRE